MLEKNKNLIAIFISIIFVIIIQLIGIGILLKEDLLKTINLDYETNDFCQTKLNSSKNTLDYLICNNKFKKEKIIFLLLDSLAYDSLHDLNNLEDYNLTNLFKGEGIEYKQTGALFETILTGKFSRNYLALNKMKMDNLPKQFKNANMNVTYYIKNFPLGGLINRKLASTFNITNGEKYIFPLSNFCNLNITPFLLFAKKYKKFLINDINIHFMKDIYKEIIYEKSNKELKNEFIKIHSLFNQCFENINFDSLVFFSDSLDTLNHNRYRNHPISLFTIYFIENLIKEIIKWINEEHSEYALVFASDHGGQLYFGEDTICNHGCNSPGNEAVFFIYTKELGYNYEKYQTIFDKGNIPIISMNDIACTISSVLKDTNFPLESTCIPRLIGNDKLLNFTNARSKEIQLIQYIEKLTKKYPYLSEKYHIKYDKLLNNNKYNKYFKDLDSIYNADAIFYDEYMKYLIDIQRELNKDVVKSGQNFLYYFIFYISLLFFILIFIFSIRKLILITRDKIFIEIKKNCEKKCIDLNKLIIYIYILIPILLMEPIMCLIYNNSKNISHIIDISIYIKFLGLLFLVICDFLLNKHKNNPKYKKIMIIIASIIILHLIMDKIELFSFLDKYINTKYRNYILKKYFCYPFLFIYFSLELYYTRNYYIHKKYNIRYIYILIPYLIVFCNYFLKFDYFYLEFQKTGHPPEIISLMKKLYIMIFLLLLFIKPFLQKENNINKVSSSNVVNFKLFLFIMINFICVEVERIEMVLFFHFILFYLCLEFKKEKDVFLKIIYLIIIICYPQIHFIANQGKYTLDTSIKVTTKCPSKWADDRPIIMGFIFVTNKFRFNIICVGYLYSLIKITKKKIMNYYTELIILIHFIQLFGIIICFFYYVKKEKDDYYIEILYLIAVQVLPITLFQIAFLINYIAHRAVNFNFNVNERSYKPINEIINIDKSYYNKDLDIDDMDKLKSSKLFLYLLNVGKAKNIGKDNLEILKIIKNDFYNLKLLFNYNWADYNILNEYSNIIKGLYRKNELEKELIFLKEYFGLQNIDNSYIINLKNNLFLFFIKKDDIYKDINKFFSFISELTPNNSEYISNLNILRENFQKNNINLNIIKKYDELLEKFFYNFKDKYTNQNNKIIINNENFVRHRIKKRKNSIDNIQPNEFILNVQFNSVDQRISYSISCKNTNIFVDIEKIFINKYPEYKDKEIYYMVNSFKVRRFKTIEENRIKNNDKIIVYIYDE